MENTPGGAIFLRSFEYWRYCLSLGKGEGNTRGIQTRADIASFIVHYNNLQDEKAFNPRDFLEARLFVNKHLPVLEKELTAEEWEEKREKKKQRATERKRAKKAPVVEKPKPPVAPPAPYPLVDSFFADDL